MTREEGAIEAARERDRLRELLHAIWLDSNRTDQWFVPVDVQEAILKMFVAKGEAHE